jgi:hypothetical protein
LLSRGDSEAIQRNVQVSTRTFMARDSSLSTESFYDLVGQGIEE